MFKRPDTVEAELYVVSTIFNAPRWRARWKLYDDFIRRIEAAGVKLLTVEVVFGNRAPVFTGRGWRHIAVRTTDEFWIKESALNIGIAALPHDFEYAAWIDGDVAIARPDWPGEIVQALQHYDVLQPWSDAIDLGPSFEPLSRAESYFASYRRNRPRPAAGGLTYTAQDPVAGRVHYWHPGYAWAARRRFFDTVGLFDRGVLGSGDRHMAEALVGRGVQSLSPQLSMGYVEAVWDWERRAAKLQANVGFVPGTLLHYWHGAKANRQYQSRWSILAQHGFDPRHGLTRTASGLYALEQPTPAFRDALRDYFRARNEDSTDTGEGGL